MLYHSTRGDAEPVTFSQLLLAGLAPDGGLYLPAQIPDVSGQLARWRSLSYLELACEIIALFVNDVAPETLRALVQRSYSSFDHEEVTPVVAVGDLFILELFHGPTLAFKDVALQFLGQAFETVLQQSAMSLNVLVATSGDTGSAAIHGLRGRRGIRVFVMHPRGRVSAAQERQMTTVLDANVHNLALEGTFDDCQRIVKELLGDATLRQRYHLSTVNSINWGRIVAQIVYYFYATFRVQERTGAQRVRFSVPTGNFGDVFAGFMASRMGLPIDRLIVATNENDILARYFTTGEYRTGAVTPTLSPSMDIQVASNFERYLYYLAGANATRLKRWMLEFGRSGILRPQPSPLALFAARSGDSTATLATIRDYWQRCQYLLDPHTALGVYAAQDYLTADIPVIALATAHPAKFADVIEQAVGARVAQHPRLTQLAELPTRVQVMAPQSAELVQLLDTTMAGRDA